MTMHKLARRLAAALPVTSPALAIAIGIPFTMAAFPTGSANSDLGPDTNTTLAINTPPPFHKFNPCSWPDITGRLCRWDTRTVSPSDEYVWITVAVPRDALDPVPYAVGSWRLGKDGDYRWCYIGVARDCGWPNLQTDASLDVKTVGNVIYFSVRFHNLSNDMGMVGALRVVYDCETYECRNFDHAGDYSSSTDIGALGIYTPDPERIKGQGNDDHWWDRWRPTIDHHVPNLEHEASRREGDRQHESDRGKTGGSPGDHRREGTTRN